MCMMVYQSILGSVAGSQGTSDGVEFDAFSEAILEAAVAQFMEYGLQRTSLNRIASAAGVSRATLFNRFPNREALERAVMLRETQRFIAEIDALVATGQTPEDRLVLGIVAAARGVRSQP